MRIYKHRLFLKWAKKEAITDQMIKAAVAEMVNGLIDADLGSGLFKKRIAMPGKGKRGSYRTLLAYQADEKAIFVYGFSKNHADNISPSDKKVLKKLAMQLLEMGEGQLIGLVKTGILYEVT